MTEEELLSEALRLTAAGNDADALPFWQQARDAASSVATKCTYLLNEARCLRVMGNYGQAEQRLEMIEAIDADHSFRVHVERARVDELYRKGQITEANSRTKEFLKKHASELANSQLSDLAYEARLSLGFGLINEEKFEEGIDILSAILPLAENEDKRRIHYFCGLALHHLKRDDNAVREFKKVLESGEQDQLSADAHYDLAMIYKSREEFTAAKQHLQAAEGLQGKITVPLRYLYTALAQVCNARGETEETKKYIRLAESLPKMKQ
jgi:tetratricopeptide (TPR) repeat protein